MVAKIFEGKNNCTVIQSDTDINVEYFGSIAKLIDSQGQHAYKSLFFYEYDLMSFTKALIYISEKTNITDIHFINCKVSQEILEHKNHILYNNFNEFILKILKPGVSNRLLYFNYNKKPEFEVQIANLHAKTHRTELEINLNALADNFRYFKSRLKPGTKTLVMVKAFSYGNGSYQVANHMQSVGVDYLGVAYADEGIMLRKSGITKPILVMNASIDNLELLLQYKLEPEIFNFRIFEQYLDSIKKSDYEAMPVHIKLETGMNRLGFQSHQIDSLIEKLNHSPEIKIAGIMSHLPTADNPEDDEFTRQQIRKFYTLSQKIVENTNSKGCIRHICNSAGTERFPEAHFDMVRFGIGLYGISAINKDNLTQISRLKTRISQIKHIPKTETVGYSLKGKLVRDSKIGVIAIGYGDGYNRLLSNRRGQVIVNGVKVPIVGNVCMDMSMIDLTDVENVKEGDEVILYGPEHPVYILAEQVNTIPYEIMTSTARRVKYMYVYN